MEMNGSCVNDSFYGPECNQECSSNGRANCVKCDIFGKCLECTNETYFGDDCDGFCDRCPDKTCYMNGTCINETATCEDPHFYGPNCSIPCNQDNIHCDTCSRNGICDSCENNFYWGPKCNDTCEFCPNEGCYNNGTCVNDTENCVNSTHYGPQCDEPCTNINSNCKLCNRSGICIECVNHTIFGKKCEESCDKCPINNTDEYGYCYIDGTCYNQTGLCTNISYSGEGCSELCSSRHNNC
jgi:hypothetical protein